LTISFHTAIFFVLSRETIFVFGIVCHFCKYDYEANNEKSENKALDVIDGYVQMTLKTRSSREPNTVFIFLVENYMLSSPVSSC